MPGDQNGEFSEMSDSENFTDEASNIAVPAPTEALATHATPRYEAIVPVAEAAADAPHRQSHLMPEPKSAAPLPTPEVTHQPRTDATPAPMVQAAPVIATDAPASAEAPVQMPAAASAPVVVAAPEPVAAVAATPAPAAKAEAAPVISPMPAPAPEASAADIDNLLSAAGLTMAVTNPDKLRAVQVASEQVTPVARAPRERKSLPPMPDEPLVQVETQR
jgi:ribonuclease E